MWVATNWTATVLAIGVSLAAAACKPSPSDSTRPVEATANAPADRLGRDAKPGPVRIDAIATGPVAVADLNGDRHLDVIVAGRQSPPLILFGDGERGLGTPQPIGRARLPQPAELAVVDQNLDGHLDFWVAVHESRDLHLFLGDGTGQLVAARDSPITVPANPHLHSLSVGDVDGDGRADLLTDSWADDLVYVHLARNDRFDVATAGFSVASQPRNNVRLVDLNRDGNLDIASPASREAGVSVLLGNGDGSFTAASDSPLPAGPSPFFVAFPDFNGDGAPEILVAHRGGSWSDNRHDALTLLRADDAGRFRRVHPFEPDVGKSPSIIAVCNLDGDDTEDAVVANAADKTLTFLFGSAHGAIHSRTSPQLGGHPFALACGDLDGDNRDEIIVTIEDPDGLELVDAPRAP